MGLTGTVRPYMLSDPQRARWVTQRAGAARRTSAIVDAPRRMEVSATLFWGDRCYRGNRFK